MTIENGIDDLSFQDSFEPSSIVCDTRDGELAIVVSQDGDDLSLRFFSNPLGIHKGKSADFARVEDKSIASVGFVVDTIGTDEAHAAKAIVQIGKLLDALPDDLVEDIRSYKRNA